MRGLRKTILWSIVIILLFSLAMCAGLMKEPTSPCLNQSSSAALTVKGVAISSSQRDNAETIMQVAEMNDLPEQAMVVALITAIQESTLENINFGYPGSSSLGLFQQIEAWGSEADRLNPEKATEMFFFGGKAGQSGLTDIPGWKDMEPGDAAQAVQRSAFPDAYATHVNEAVAVVGAYTGGSSGNSAGACDTAAILDGIVHEALSHEGDPYTWSPPPDGASFVSAMFAAQGIDVPDTIDQLASYTGDDKAGIHVQWIPATDVGSLRNGDIPFWGTAGASGQPKPTATGIYVGGLGNEFKIATYNVHGSSHTTNSGLNSGPNRMDTAAKVITGNGIAVVGLQELQRNQRSALMKALGRGWRIWPEPAVYRDSKANDLPNSQNSIAWDTSQVERVECGSLPMPYYFAGLKLPRDIPLCRLQQLSTGQGFWVANTHDPAYSEHADLRKLDAEQHAHDMERLVKTGFPVFMTGDFNSGFAVRSRGNTTARGLRSNLTWCIMTESGTMINGYDAAQTPPRTGYCPEVTSREKGVGIVDHIYVSTDVQVSDYTVVDRRFTASDHDVVYVTAAFKHSSVTDVTDPGSLGAYVGPAEDQSIKVQPVRKTHFLGAVRFTFTVASPIVNGKWTLPLPRPYRLTNYFGQPASYYATGYHTGQDFAPYNTNSSVVAATSGSITKVSWDANGYGNYVVETITDGTELWYCHLKSVDVAEGDTVGVGDKIGIAGETGNATGVHLHFEVRPHGGDPADPMPYLREYGLNP